ncbi:hypothetical protein SAMN06265348_1202 [Pedobacter westerhofensis]|uniref:Uncharacterized protein n=1 Tax=Pedobacter westerhofensis TaxID=425512 RepID=A0A521FSB4_9SPHI|nr:hypothetical protein [Pedobacter westerhofensis]SMO99115.1 hypothetical protein SAMN06265348_1202 [Pedobacter westerhofensis]
MRGLNVNNSLKQLHFKYGKSNLSHTCTRCNARCRSSTHANLIPLAACGTDKMISQTALSNLKEHCTTSIEQDVFKAMEAFVKASNALNSLKPNTLSIECSYLSQDFDGTLAVNYYKL